MSRSRLMFRIGAAALPLLALPAPAAAQMTQAALDGLATDLGYRFEVIDNAPDRCPDGIDGCFLSTITLTMPDRVPQGLQVEALSLYFSFVSRLPLVESAEFQNSWINGDLNRLTLKPGARLQPGASYTIRLWGLGNQFSSAHAMPNAYLAVDGLVARTIAATRPQIDSETGLEVLPFVAPMVDEAKLATKGGDDRTRWLTPERAFVRNQELAAPAAADVAILPRPAEVRRPAGRALDLRRGLNAQLSGFELTAIEPALTALDGAGARRSAGGVPLRISVSTDADIAPEGYRLNAGDGAISIEARDAAGASNALRSLAQQIAFEGGATLRPIEITDAPRYGFRGLHVDLGRNFHSKEQLLKLVEAAAAFKLNRLHLHLAEDEGWRLEVPDLPELTEIGSRRCHDPSETRCLLPQLGAGPDGDGVVNGFLTRADYVEIVRAAAARHIEVIPSIDMPGHSRAAIRAMEARHARLMSAGQAEEAARYRLIDPDDRTDYRSIQNYKDNTLNVCLPSTYAFIDKVVEEIAAMHGDAGQPLRTFHLGADETAGAWVQSPACRTMIAEAGGDATRLTPMFIQRVSARLAEQGYRVGGWSDGMGHTAAAAMPATAQTNIWGMLHTTAISEAHDQANRGWTTILSIPDLGYFDMPYVPNPTEGGYDWASRSVDTRQVFSFFTGNLPANAAMISNTHANYQVVADQPQLASGEAVDGVQAQLWSETVRTDAGVDYMLFPRLLALAERGWSAAPWEPAYQPGATWTWQDARIDRGAIDAAWSDFAGRLAAQLPLLDRIGVAYRIAPPGAKIEGGMLHANAELPGTAIEYRTAGGDWARYADPVRMIAPVEVRARNADGRRASRSVVVAPAE